MKRAASDSGGANKAPRTSPGPSKRSPSYSIETDPSEDPATTPPEFLISREEDPAEGSYDTDPSEDPTTTPPELLTPGEDSYDTDPSEYSSGTPEEEISEPLPAAPVVEHYVRQASPESVTPYSSPLSWPSVNQELPGYLYPSNSDAANSGSQTSGGQTDEDDDGHASHGSSPGQTRD